jgi:Protein of unknown function (DUF3040)
VAWPGLMEVAFVSLSAREQQMLGRIADELAASDPGLASTLGVFNRLTSGEEMPARQQVRAGRPRRTTRARSPVTVWLLLLIVLIAVAVVLSHTSHPADVRPGCTQLVPSTCAQPARTVPASRP